MDVEPSNSFHVVAVIAHDGEFALTRILESVASMSLPLIALESPPADDTHEVLSRWMAQHSGVIVRRINGSLRRPLRAGFAAARDLGFTHVLTFGSAGEHHPEDLARLMKSAAENPSALIVGYRDETLRRSFPGRMSELFIRLETGLRLRDARSGLRIYPLRLIDTICPRRTRNPGEMEILVRAAWAGCPVMEVASAAPLAVMSGHPSRSDEARCTFAELATHVRLLARALSGWPHRKYESGIAPAPRRPFWRSLWQWCNPVRVWRELRQGGAGGRGEMAVGLAVGVFIANTPTYGFQTLLALYASRRLHLHPVTVVAGSKASTPPIGPFLIAAAIFVGHLLLHGARPPWQSFPTLDWKFFLNAGPILLDWAVGSLVVGTATALGTFIVTYVLFRFFERRKTGDAVIAPEEPCHMAHDVLIP